MNKNELKRSFRSWIEKLRHEKTNINTIKQYERAVKSFIAFIEASKIDEINLGSLLSYAKYLEDAPVKKNTTYNAKIIGLNKFFKDAGHPDLRLKTKKVNSKGPMLLEDHYKKLIDTAKELKMDRERLLMQVLASTGIKLSELEAFNVNDIKRDNLKVNDRLVVIPESLKEDLLGYASKNGITGLIFASSRDPNKILDNSQINRNFKYIAKEAFKDAEKPVDLKYMTIQGLRNLYIKRILTNIDESLAYILEEVNANTLKLYLKELQRAKL